MGCVYGTTGWSVYLLVSILNVEISISILKSIIYSEELCASVVGYSKNCYRCCDSVEEGHQALRAFLERQTAAPSSVLTTPQPVLEEYHGSTMFVDDSWWCCFAGAEPGVYNGL